MLKRITTAISLATIVALSLPASADTNYEYGIKTGFIPLGSGHFTSTDTSSEIEIDTRVVDITCKEAYGDSVI